MSQQFQITRSRRPSRQRGARRKTFCGVTFSWGNKVSSFLIPKLPSGTAAYRHKPGKYDDYVADDTPISKSHHPVMNACARGHPKQVRWSQGELSAGVDLIFFEICQEKNSLFLRVRLWNFGFPITSNTLKSVEGLGNSEVLRYGRDRK